MYLIKVNKGKYYAFHIIAIEISVNIYITVNIYYKYPFMEKSNKSYQIIVCRVFFFWIWYLILYYKI